MRRLILALLFALPLVAQTPAVTNPACPNATGPDPHCTVLSWTAPTTGIAPTGYNLYTGGTTPGQCATVTASTCTKIGTVTAGVLTFTYNSSASVTLADGSTHYFVLTSVNGPAESGPSAEVSAVTPFLVPNAPASPKALTQ